MKKRMALVFVVFVVIIAIGALTGCGGDDKRGTTGKSSSVEITTGADGRQMEGNLYLTGLPLVENTETFTLFTDDGGLPEDKVMYPILEEQTNVVVDLMLYPYEQAVERKNILLNSGDYPDVMGGWIMKEEDIKELGVKEKIFIPLTELIEKYSPIMVDILSREGVTETMTLPDGEIYSIPFLIGEPLVTFNPWINQRWLDNVGMEMPTTTDELLEVLRVFKKQDANGNGDPTDEIPFSANEVGNGFPSALAGWWGVNAASNNRVPYSSEVDGQLEFLANTDEYKQMIEYFALLNEERLLDTEVFTQDGILKSKVEGDEVGVLFDYDGISNDDEPLDSPYNTLNLAAGAQGAARPVPVLTSPNGNDPIYRRASYGASVFRNQMAITDLAENPATIMRWWDNLYQLDNSIQIQAGLFGKRLEKIGEGEYRYLDEKLLSKEDKEKYGWGNMFTTALPKWAPPEIIIAPIKGEVAAFDVHKDTDALYEPYLDKMTARVWIDDEYQNELAILRTSISDYVEQKTAEWISGIGDVNEEWEEYNEDLLDLGVERYIEINRNMLAE